MAVYLVRWAGLYLMFIALDKLGRPHRPDRPNEPDSRPRDVKSFLTQICLFLWMPERNIRDYDLLFWVWHFSFCK